MQLSFVLFAWVATLVLAQEDEETRCDGASYKVPCAEHPEIMALQTTECRPYHVLLARGTDEKPPGRQGNITKMICDRLGGAENCGWENLDYPATNRFISDDTWCRSADVGAENGEKQVRKYVKNCPDSRVILLGYSQGASIVQDIMGGGGGEVFKCNQSLNTGLSRTEAPGANSTCRDAERMGPANGVPSCCSCHLWHRKKMSWGILRCQRREENRGCVNA
jgi:acetylxylan esterase